MQFLDQIIYVYDSLNLIAFVFMQAVEETLEQIELCFTLETLLLKKKSLSNGDSPELHAGKVQ